MAENWVGFEYKSAIVLPAGEGRSVELFTQKPDRSQ